MRLKNKKYEKKGISVIAFIIIIGVMLILISTVTVSLDSVVTNSRKRQFAKEIFEIQTMVDSYKKHNNDYPYIKTAEGNKIIELEKNNKNEDQLASEDIIDNKVELYVINLQKIGVNELSRGYNKDNDETDVYAFSNKTGKVYYVKGYKVRKNKYYSLTDELKNLIGINTSKLSSSGIIKREDSIYNNGYINSGLILYLDGIDNTRSGHSATTTVWEDLSGNNNDFILDKFDGTSVSGWQNKSLKFDGVNDYLVSKEIFDFNNTDALTIQFVDLNGELYSNDNSTFQPIFETSVNFNNNNNAFLVNFNEWKNKTICFSTQQNGYNIQYDTDELIAGESMMYTLTFDVKNGHNNYFNMYKNTEKRNITKVAQYSVNLNNFNFNPYPLYIGSRAGTQYFCKMNLASVRIYNRALTEEEIKHNYDIDKERFNLE